MKKIFFKISLIVVILITWNSCKKYLEEKSDKSLVVLQSIDDLQGLLDYNDVMNKRSPTLMQSSDDDFFVSAASYNSMVDIFKQTYAWQIGNYLYPNDWSYGYAAIYNSNYCLEQVAKITKNDQNISKWNNIKGSALFFRSYYFLRLLWQYSKAYDIDSSMADPGVVLRLVTDFNVPSIRSSVKDCYQQVINDISQAIELLPDNPVHVMRPSKAASYGMLAECYLSMRIYDSALKYSTLCLNLKNDLLDYNNPSVNISSLTPFQPFNPEIIFYSSQAAGGPKSQAYSLVDTVLFRSYSDSDLRKSTFFYSNRGNYSFKGQYTASLGLFFSGIATDEIYLIRSECYARRGDVGNALADLNALLRKRWVKGQFNAFNNLTKKDALLLILQERRKELTQRSLRWIDIKRLNKESENVVLTRVVDGQQFTLLPNGNRYALPLPLDVINQTGMPQNEQ